MTEPTEFPSTADGAIHECCLHHVDDPTQHHHHEHWPDGMVRCHDAANANPPCVLPRILCGLQVVPVVGGFTPIEGLAP